MALVINVINGNIRMLVQMGNTLSSHLANKFPIGDVYVRMLEPQGIQWRVLQRGTRMDDKRTFFDALLPINVDQLPDVVQVVHACTS